MDQVKLMKTLFVLLGLVTVGVILIVGTIIYTTPVTAENTTSKVVKNNFIVSDKAHVKNVICRYTIVSADTLYTIKMVDACSKWEVNQPVIFKQR